MTQDPREAGPDELVLPMIFVPQGQEPPAEWLAAHPDWVKIPAVMVPHGAPSPAAWLAERAKDPPGRPRRDQPDAAGKAGSQPDWPGQGALGDPVAAYRQVSEVFDAPGRAAGLLAAEGTPAAAPYLVADATPPGVRSDAAVRLKENEEAAYAASPNDCSGEVRAVLQRQKIAFTFGNANDFMGRAAQPGSGWRQVTLEEASRLANEGKVVVAGKANPGGHGHIETVAPGPWHSAGGFMAGGKWMGPTKELYPPVVSGALSSYEGAHSHGEKTVRDAWAPQDFPKVTYWVFEK